MSWQSVQEAVRVAVASALGLQDALGADGVNYVRSVDWENRDTGSRAIAPGAPWVNLRLGAVRQLGKDEIRREYDDTGDITTSRLVPNYCGFREFTVNVEIGIEDQDPGEEAVAFLADRLRTRIRRESVLAALQTAEVAHVGTEATINADFQDMDGRMCSRSITDFLFRTAINDVDDDAAGDFVLHADGEGEEDLEGADFDV